MNHPIVIVKGSDPVLIADAASAQLHQMVGDADRNEVVDTFSGDDFEVSDVIIAARAVSMFGERVIVMRNGARFNVEALSPLISYAEDPNPTSRLLVVWDKPVKSGERASPLPKKLTDAVKACGGIVVASDVSPNAKYRTSWLDDQMRSASVKFLPQTKQLIIGRLGEDVSRLGGIIRLLEASFPAGSKLEPSQVEPFLGDGGSVPPWDLTDAIDAGDVPKAVANARRMMGAGERHPLQILATLNSHFLRMLRLDGSGVRNETDAAELLGMKKGSTFPAKKAMNQCRKLGSDRIGKAVQLLAATDVGLRGATAVPAVTQMEVLVARLAQLSRPSRR